MFRGFRFDALNKTLIFVSMGLTLLFRSMMGYFLSGVCITLFILRNISKDYGARERENDMFINFFRNIKSRFTSKAARRVRPVKPVYAGETQQSRPKSDKEHKVYKCPKCKQPLRVPRGKGKILITCRSCGHKFEKKT